MHEVSTIAHENFVNVEKILSPYVNENFLSVLLYFNGIVVTSYFYDVIIICSSH